MIKYGCGIITWIVWDRRKGCTTKLSQVIDEISTAGYDGIELICSGGISRLNERDENKNIKDEFGSRANFLKTLRNRNLALSGIYFTYDFHNPSEHDRIVEKAAETADLVQYCESSYMIIGPPSRPDRQTEKHFEVMAKALNDIGKSVHEYGVKVAIHPHNNSIIEVRSEVDKIMEMTNPEYVLLAPDTAHLRIAGVDENDLIESYKNRCVYFHFKDAFGVMKARGDYDEFSHRISELGCGEVCFPRIMKLLKRIRFDGWIVTDHDFARRTPMETIKNNIDYFRNTLMKIYNESP